MVSKKRIKVVGNLGSGHEAQNVHDPTGIAPTVRENHGKTTKIVVQALTERRTEEAKKIRRQMQKQGKDWCPRREKELVPRQDNIANNLTATQTVEQLVSVTPKSTLGQPPSTETTTPTPATEMQPELFGRQSLISTFLSQDSLAKVFRLLGKEAVSKIVEELYSLKSQGHYPLKDLNFVCWRMSKDYSHMITGEPLELSSQPFLSWGIFSNGRYLTARISEFPRTGNESSLSDVLESEVSEKYFLSSKITQKILGRTKFSRFTQWSKRQKNSPMPSESEILAAYRQHSKAEEED
jgi:hypothetical protein